MPPRTPSNIAVIQTAFLGDVALALPLVQDLRYRFPYANIVVVTTPAAAELVRCAEACNHVVVFDKRGSDAGLRGILRLSRLLRKHRVDIVFGLQRSVRTSLLALLCRAPIRIGFREASASFLYSHRVPWRQEKHEIERNHDLLKALVADVSDAPTRMADVVVHAEAHGLPPSISQQYERAPISRRIVLAPGSVWKTKRWPQERWTELATVLRQRGASVVIMGGREDARLCETIAADSHTVAVCDASLPQSINLLQQADTLVTNDSAPTHLAALAGTRTVTIFGSTLPSFGFAPRGAGDVVVEDTTVACRPCGLHGRRECPLGTLQCLHAISTQHVLGALESPSALTSA